MFSFLLIFTSIFYSFSNSIISMILTIEFLSISMVFLSNELTWTCLFLLVMLLIMDSVLILSTMIMTSYTVGKDKPFSFVWL